MKEGDSVLITQEKLSVAAKNQALSISLTATDGPKLKTKV
jgi:hypothetical protein